MERHENHDHNEHEEHHKMVEGENSAIEYLKFFGVISVIISASFIISQNYTDGGYLELMRIFMGIFFLVFAGFKFIGYKMFAMMFAGYDVLAKRVKAYSYAFPFIELGLGIAYLSNLLPVYREVLTILVMGIGVIGVVQEIKKRSGVHCACLGNIIKLPLSTVSLTEDVLMVAMAVTMLLNR
jgi:hypothetical protein